MNEALDVLEDVIKLTNSGFKDQQDPELSSLEITGLIPRPRSPHRTSSTVTRSATTLLNRSGPESGYNFLSSTLLVYLTLTFQRNLNRHTQIHKKFPEPSRQLPPERKNCQGHSSAHDIPMI